MSKAKNTNADRTTISTTGARLLLLVFCSCSVSSGKLGFVEVVLSIGLDVVSLTELVVGSVVSGSSVVDAISSVVLREMMFH